MQVGSVLRTRDGRITGNAIIAHEMASEYSDDAVYMVVTDFGNHLYMNQNEIENWFYVTDPTDVTRWFLDRTRLQNKMFVIPSHLRPVL